jgi:hypothetical protein
VPASLIIIIIICVVTVPEAAKLLDPLLLLKLDGLKGGHAMPAAAVLLLLPLLLGATMEVAAITIRPSRVVAAVVINHASIQVQKGV